MFCGRVAFGGREFDFVFGMLHTKVGTGGRNGGGGGQGGGNGDGLTDEDEPTCCAHLADHVGAALLQGPLAG